MVVFFGNEIIYKIEELVENDTKSYANVFEWIAEAWDKLDLNFIARSFQYCGVTSNNLTFCANF